MMLPMISEKEFCEHIEDDDFPIRYGNPVCIHTNDGHLLVCMTYKLKLPTSKVGLHLENSIV